MEKNNWHLSKSVPVTLIVALVLQAAAIVWTVSQMQSSIEANATNLIRLETRTEKLEMAVQSQAVALARIDENIKAIRTHVERIASKGLRIKECYNFRDLNLHALQRMAKTMGYSGDMKEFNKFLE